MTLNLFDDTAPDEPSTRQLAPGALLLRGFVQGESDGGNEGSSTAMLADIEAITSQAPFRHLVTPGGFTMSVAMSNCGQLGWVSSRRGYRYVSADPISGNPWPCMPASWLALASRAATAAGYPGFVPDACLINQYAPGSKMSLHQDRDEHDLSQPIVSLSLGLPAVFLFGGLKRSDKPQRVPLQHGDVVVWGGPTRLAFHGVMPLEEGEHALLGRRRINLTFRCASC